ncbi:unnamed protein product [Amoebophrya sp. A120]|nr:unnamed protein product [Amoebophrya sp. A120]CAD7953423.1 unnamed protein product [Amoebophrya sp. A120]|eukprot:GSA120T00013560001.1
MAQPAGGGAAAPRPQTILGQPAQQQAARPMEERPQAFAPVPKSAPGNAGCCGAFLEKRRGDSPKRKPPLLIAILEQKSTLPQIRQRACIVLCSRISRDHPRRGQGPFSGMQSAAPQAAGQRLSPRIRVSRTLSALPLPSRQINNIWPAASKQIATSRHPGRCGSLLFCGIIA